MSDHGAIERKKLTLRTRGRHLKPEESKRLLKEGRDVSHARSALKAAQTSAFLKEWNLVAAIGPNSTAEQHYEKVVKALPPPPEREDE